MKIHLFSENNYFIHTHHKAVVDENMQIGGDPMITNNLIICTFTQNVVYYLLLQSMLKIR
jgi:hypothetical protein